MSTGVSGGGVEAVRGLPLPVRVGATHGPVIKRATRGQVVAERWAQKCRGQLREREEPVDPALGEAPARGNVGDAVAGAQEFIAPGVREARGRDEVRGVDEAG